MGKSKVNHYGQVSLPGIGQTKDEAIHAKALEVKGYEKKRLEYLGKETGARNELEILMKDRKLTKYVVDGVTVEMVAEKVKAKVKLSEEESPEESSED